MIDKSVVETLRAAQTAATSVILQFRHMPPEVLAGATTRASRVEAVGAYMRRRLAEVFPDGVPDELTVQTLDGIGQSLISGSSDSLANLLSRAPRLADAGDISVRANTMVPAPNTLQS